jgi:hypothetical protein
MISLLLIYDCHVARVSLMFSGASALDTKSRSSLKVMLLFT